MVDKYTLKFIIFIEEYRRGIHSLEVNIQKMMKGVLKHYKFQSRSAFSPEEIMKVLVKLGINIENVVDFISSDKHFKSKYIDTYKDNVQFMTPR